jgi:hypothetical protein
MRLPALLLGRAEMTEVCSHDPQEAVGTRADENCRRTAWLLLPIHVDYIHTARRSRRRKGEHTRVHERQRAEYRHPIITVPDAGAQCISGGCTQLLCCDGSLMQSAALPVPTQNFFVSNRRVVSNPVQKRGP